MDRIELTSLQVKNNNTKTMKKGLFSNLKKDQKFELLIEYIEETGKLPKYDTQYKEENIRAFLSRIKRGQTSITGEQLNELLKYIPDLDTKKIKIKEEKKVKNVKSINFNVENMKSTSVRKVS